VVEDKVLPFKAGDVSIINHTELHLARSAAGTISEWVFISLDPVRLLGAITTEPEWLRTESFSGHDFNNVISGDSILISTSREGDISHAVPRYCIAELVQELIAELRQKRAGYRSVVRATVWRMMMGLHRISGDALLISRSRRERDISKASPDIRRRGSVERVAPALAHLASHYNEEIQVRELARLCFTSVTHLRRLMRAATGHSPHEYLTRLRLQMAATLLASSTRSILDISLDVGFPTLSSFNRHFKTHFKMPPREWRKGSGREKVV
jgi:AraC-like DNA-binding protein